MTTEGGIPGWRSEATQPPDGRIPGWDSGTPGAPSDPSARSIGARIVESFELYRIHARRVVALALLFQGVLSIPLVIASVTGIQRVLDIWSQMFSGSVRSVWESSFAWTTGPFHDPAMDQALLGVAVGLSALGGFLAMAATAILILDPASAHRTVMSVAAETVRRGRPIFVLGFAIAALLGAFYWLEGRWIADLIGQGPGPISNPRAAAASAASAATGAVLLFVIALVLEGGLFYAIVRWSVAIPALAVEGLSLRAALGRSSQLTKGRRLSILWLIMVAGFAVTVVASILIYGPVIAVVVGGLGSEAISFALVIGLTATAAICAPPMTILVAILYRDLRDAGPREPREIPPLPPGWGSSG